MKLFKPAYICFEPKEKLVARIIYPDGTRSMYLVTKRQALEVAESQLGINLTIQELNFIKEQIHSSEMIDHNLRLEEITSNIQSEIEEIKHKIEEAQKNS